MPLKDLCKKLLSDPMRLTPPEGGAHTPTDIQLVGRQMIEVSLCRGICLYTREKIVLRIREGRLTICGAELSLHTYRCRRIGVSGRIDALHFERD